MPRATVLATEVKTGRAALGDFLADIAGIEV